MFLATRLTVAWVLILSCAALWVQADEPVQTQPTPIPPPPQTRPSDLSEAALKTLRDVDAKVANVTDLTADFQQTKRTALLRKPLMTSGVVRVVGKAVRWDAAPPRESVVLIRDASIQFFYPQQKVLEIYEIDKKLADFAASPLMRLDMIHSFFDLAPGENGDWSAPGDAEQIAGGHALAIRLIPKREDLRGRIESVRVLVDVDAGRLAAVEIRNAGGDVTGIRFKNVVMNQGIQPSALDIKTPTGTRISKPLEAIRGGGD